MAKELKMFDQKRLHASRHYNFGLCDLCHKVTRSLLQMSMDYNTRKDGCFRSLVVFVCPRCEKENTIP